MTLCVHLLRIGNALCFAGSASICSRRGASLFVCSQECTVRVRVHVQDCRPM